MAKKWTIEERAERMRKRAITIAKKIAAGHVYKRTEKEAYKVLGQTPPPPKELPHRRKHNRELALRDNTPTTTTEMPLDAIPERAPRAWRKEKEKVTHVREPKPMRNGEHQPAPMALKVVIGNSMYTVEECRSLHAALDELFRR